MQLLQSKDVKRIKKSQEIDEKEVNLQRKQEILKDIDEFNHRKDVLEKSNLILEEEFNKFCSEINGKRKVLLNEIRLLEKQKQDLTDFVARLQQEIKI